MANRRTGKQSTPHENPPPKLNMQLGSLLNDPSPVSSSQGHPATMTNSVSSQGHPATKANTVPRSPFRGHENPFQFPTTTASNPTGEASFAPGSNTGHHGHNSIPREDGHPFFHRGQSFSSPQPNYHTNSGRPSSLTGKYSPTLHGPDPGPNNQGSLSNHRPHLSRDSQSTMNSAYSPNTSGPHSRLSSMSSLHSFPDMAQ